MGCFVLLPLFNMAIDFKRINNSPFALLVWYLQDGKEDEAKVFSCVASWDPESSSVYLYRNGSDKPALTLSGDQLNRINIVSEDMKEDLLNADFGISLTMGNLPADLTGKLNPTGLKW